jgi:hypothetical protein
MLCFLVGRVYVYVCLVWWEFGGEKERGKEGGREEWDLIAGGR